MLLWLIARGGGSNQTIVDTRAIALVVTNQTLTKDNSLQNNYFFRKYH